VEGRREVRRKGMRRDWDRDKRGLMRGKIVSCERREIGKKWIRNERNEEGKRRDREE